MAPRRWDGVANSSKVNFFMRKLLIATGNPGKLKEMKKALSDLPLKIVTLQDLDISERVIEDGKTFEENAIKKAWYYCQKSGLPTIADDGGLEIDILKGEPGVRSKRWIDGKENPTDKQLIAYTIKSMASVPKEQRSAQLRTVVALAFPSGEVFTSEGVVRGVIAQRPAKEWTKGYPYRALFYLPQIKKFYNEDSFSKKEEKRYAHRIQALKNLKRIIEKDNYWKSQSKND